MPPKLLALLRLIRPELPTAAGICVVVGQVIALGRLPDPADAGRGFALGFLLSSSAMIFNDYFDVEVDRVNAPQRPLPAGLLTLREALAAGVLAAALGLAAALLIHPAVLFLSLVTWGLGFLYNWKWKAAGIWGNLIVALNVAMTFLLGGISVGRLDNPILWVFALIAFTFDLAEEIAGDAMDLDGDRQRGSKSLAIVRGRAAALRAASLLFVVVIGLTLVPILLGETSLGYIAPIVAMDALIVVFLRKLRRSTTREAGHQAMRGMYLSATLGLVAFVIGRFV